MKVKNKQTNKQTHWTDEMKGTRRNSAQTV